MDASVAARWHLPDEEHLTEARQLLIHFASGDIELFAPSEIRHEVASGASAATRAGHPALPVLRLTLFP